MHITSWTKQSIVVLIWFMKCVIQPLCTGATFVSCCIKQLLNLFFFFLNSILKQARLMPRIPGLLEGCLHAKIVFSMYPPEMGAQMGLQDQKACTDLALSTSGVRGQWVHNNNAKRISLLTSFPYFPNNQLFPPKTPRSDNSSHCTTSCSRRLGHGVNTQPAHFQEVIWG